jgi:fermentation-respiration switch protein FrsA (DUF1100 family)
MNKLPKHSAGQPKGLVQRRKFLEGAATLAGASLIGRAVSAAPTPSPVPAPPIMTPDVERRTKRWQDQRWLLDAVIDTVGIEWDQGRLGGLVGACGPEVLGDVAGIRARVHKFNDLTREFARAAVRRQKIAQAYEQDGRTIGARENYFMSALLFPLAQWAIFENTKENLALNDRKNACYAMYMKYADHEVRRVEVPFAGKSLPGYLHLPPNRSGRVPCVWSISGLDSTKEGGSALYGDKLRERGIATLALEGPGQGECSIREIHLTQTNWMQAGPAVLEWLRSQKEIDPDRIALRGASLGSFLATQVAASDSRLKGCAARATAIEPHMYTAFQTQSPSFKLRFMYYTGLQTEADLDSFLQSWSLQGISEKVTCPYFLMAGEDDQLCPLEYTFELMNTVSAPKQLIVYEGALHGVNSAPSVTNGPNTGDFEADWLQDRLDGKPMQDKYMKVDAAGRVRESTFEEASKALSIDLG